MRKETRAKVHILISQKDRVLHGVFKGRFLKDISADDVLFGNTFDRSLKLPWGSSLALKFMNFIDPTLDHALGSESPWALSPLIATMPYFAITKGVATPALDTTFCEAQEPILRDDTQALRNYAPDLPTPDKRRSYFSLKANRKAITFTPHDTITTDFCYGFLTFPNLTLDLPGGISFDLMRYWDGQPVRFVCCERKHDDEGQAARGPGETFWCIVIEVVEED